MLPAILSQLPLTALLLAAVYLCCLPYLTSQTYILVRPKYLMLSDVNRELVFTFKSVSCHDALYTYKCIATLSNAVRNMAVDTFSVITPPPTISLLASPHRKVYRKDTVVTLTCSSGDDLIGVQRNLTRWVWEYNDVRRWTTVSTKNATGGKVEASGPCFWKARPTSLKVNLKDFGKGCSRRFRCYFKHDSVSSIDDAAEFLVTMGYNCHDSHAVVSKDPVVPIVSIVAAMAIICSLAFGLYAISSYIRKKKKQKQVQEMGMKILSPMSPAQRERLLREKEKNAPPAAPALPAPALIQLTESTSVIGADDPESTSVIGADDPESTSVIGADDPEEEGEGGRSRGNRT
ncbi:hypothetical protein ACOMHN_034440 [Nucella lapillus]